MSAFDRLCWFAEHHPKVVSTLDYLLRRAALFQFPHVPQDVLPKSYSQDELAFQQEFFCLPFQVTAIEDRSSCVLLWDDRDTSGLGVDRFFIECASMSEEFAQTWRNADEEMAHRANLSHEQRRQLNRTHSLAFGVLSVDTSESALRSETYMIHGRLFQHALFDDSRVAPTNLTGDPQVANQLVTHALRSAMTGIEELMMFNRPDRFILRDQPDHLREKQKKIPRAHQRPVYTLLHAHEIRSKLHLPTPTAAGPGGRFVGERRRHVRRYPDDPERWPNAHGKTIIIPATWVGPSEATVGRRQFKIMLDL